MIKSRITKRDEKKLFFIISFSHDYQGLVLWIKLIFEFFELICEVFLYKKITKR
jgi:hypothetical protein